MAKQNQQGRRQGQEEAGRGKTGAGGGRGKRRQGQEEAGAGGGMREAGGGRAGQGRGRQGMAVNTMGRLLLETPTQFG